MCIYSNLYAYLHNEDKNYIFFSKYNIFDEKTDYDKDVYSPLNKEQFDIVLEYYRNNLTLIKCNKYPSLDIDIPKCTNKKELSKHFENINNEKIYNSS